MNPEIHDDDDDQPTLQRISPTSTKIAAAAQHFDPFADEATTANDLDVLPDTNAGDAIEPALVVAAHEFVEIDTEKMPIDIRAGLVRASQVDDGA